MAERDMRMCRVCGRDGDDCTLCIERALLRAYKKEMLILLLLFMPVIFVFFFTGIKPALIILSPGLIAGIANTVIFISIRRL
jgi:hypothetical protein